MKRLINSNYAIPILDHSIYKSLRMSNQVNGPGEKRIFHFSYNLALDAEQARCLRSIDEDGVGQLTKNDCTLPSQQVMWALSQKGDNAPEKEIERNIGTRYSCNNEDGNGLAHGGAKQGYVLKTPKMTIMEDAAKKNNGFEINRRKCGLGEATNVPLMRHKLRKKAVCDITDNSHYQRQFLRVLNKRF